MILFFILQLMTIRAEGVEVGALAPLMKLKNFMGQSVDMKNFASSSQKRNLLLIFFRTGSCNVCVVQLQEIARDYSRFSASNVAVIGVSADDAIIHAETSRKIEGRFPLLLDPDAKLIKAFGVYHSSEKLARPSVFLIGPDQRVLFGYVGQAISDRLSEEKLLDVVRHYSGQLPSAASAVSGK